MTLYKRKGSRAWYYDFEFEGQRYNASTKRTNKREAQQFEDDLKRKLRARQSAGYSEDWTAGKVYDTYKADNDKRLRGWRSADGQLIAFIRFIGRDKVWGDLTQRDFAEYRKFLSEMKANTQHAYFARIRVVMNWLAEMYPQVRLPKDWKMPKIKTTRKVRYLRNKEEEQALLDSFDNPPQEQFRERYADTKELVIFLLDTGVRASEAVHLTWDDLYFDRRVAEVYRSKTDRIDEVPLSDRVITMLKERRRRVHSKWVFPAFDDLKLPRRIDNQSLLGAYDRAGLNSPEKVQRYGEFTTHSLRHTYATRMAQKGMPPVQLQRLMGHDNINTTMIYVQMVSADGIGNALDILNGDW